MGVEWSSPYHPPATRRQRAAILAAAAAGAVWLALGQPDVGETATSPDVMSPAGAAPSTAQCQEDEPCWDCETMGNMVCGPDHRQALPATG